MGTNRLLQRRQFLVEVIHPGMGGVSKTDLKEKISKMYKVSDPSCILLYGFKVAFGGGRSTGFGMIYDSLVAAKKYEPKYRLTRFGMGKAKGVGARSARTVRRRFAASRSQRVRRRAFACACVHICLRMAQALVGLRWMCVQSVRCACMARAGANHVIASCLFDPLRLCTFIMFCTRGFPLFGCCSMRVSLGLKWG